jgi:hypothetical protein
MADGSSSLDRFAALAAVYCEWIEDFQRHSPEVFLSSIQPVIAQLYAIGLILPPLPESDEEHPDEQEMDDAVPPWLAESAGLPDADPDQVPVDAWWSLYASLSAFLGPRNSYREVVDPYEPTSEQEVTASLADDLADIYRDLLRGCRKWARGECSAAHWEWRFGLESHWGEHATGALRAIHCLAAWYALPWPSSGAA